MKVKFGTQLDDELYIRLKIVAAREQLSLGQIVHLALADYLNRRSTPSGYLGLGRLLEDDPLRITPEHLRESMESDYWDQ